jgi:hypothetical protein
MGHKDIDTLKEILLSASKERVGEEAETDKCGDTANAGRTDKASTTRKQAATKKGIGAVRFESVRSGEKDPLTLKK